MKSLCQAHLARRAAAPDSHDPLTRTHTDSGTVDHAEDVTAEDRPGTVKPAGRRFRWERAPTSLPRLLAGTLVTGFLVLGPAATEAPDRFPAMMAHSLTTVDVRTPRQPPEQPYLPGTTGISDGAEVLKTAGFQTVTYVDPTTGADSAVSVLRAFDKPPQNWLPGHRGVDLALQVGSPVLAAADGVVAFAGSVAGTPTISIDHADGIRTTYQPVHPVIHQGEQVTMGQQIGRLAHSTDGWPGLHWGARIGEDYQNPLSLLSRPVIRLKPVDGPADKLP